MRRFIYLSIPILTGGESSARKNLSDLPGVSGGEPVMPAEQQLPAIASDTALYPLYVVNFIGTLGFSIVIPFLVFLVIQFGGNAFVYGFLASTYSAFQLVGAPILGRASDVYGRKRILLISQAGTMVSWIVFLVALFLPATAILSVNSTILGTFVLTLPLLVLFIARALDGITGGNVSVANAYLADVTTEEDRTKNFGRMSVASNLGFIVGPAIAAILGGTVYAELLPVIAALIISIAGVLIIIVYLPDQRPMPIRESPEPRTIRKLFGQEQKDCYRVEEPQGSRRLTLRAAFSISHVPYMLSLYFLIFFGFNIFYTAFPVFAAGPLGWTSGQLGIYLSVLSGLMVVIQGPVLSRLSRRYAEGYLIVAGNLILGTNFVLLSTGNLLLIYLAIIFFAVGNGLMWPSVLSALSKVAGKIYQGAVQGFASSAGSLASIAGLIAGGLLYEQFGALTFLITAGVIYLVFLLSFRVLTFQQVRGAQTAEHAAPQ
jgi:DHA1 family tetracycline resistance protein-like MFS transporter